MDLESDYLLNFLNQVWLYVKRQNFIWISLKREVIDLKSHAWTINQGWLLMIFYRCLLYIYYINIMKKNDHRWFFHGSSSQSKQAAHLHLPNNISKLQNYNTG